MKTMRPPHSMTNALSPGSKADCEQLIIQMCHKTGDIPATSPLTVVMKSVPKGLIVALPSPLVGGTSAPYVTLTMLVLLLV
jgi:hypothetical protein